MLKLALATQPGPFVARPPARTHARTNELEQPIGIRVNGQLVAMAGKRFVLPGMNEINAVCTEPEFRGHGWAAALTGEIAARIFERGEQPFLHVVESNTTARRVYERINFEDRCLLDHVYVSPVAK